MEGAQPQVGALTWQNSARRKPFPGEVQITRNPLNHTDDDSLIATSSCWQSKKAMQFYTAFPPLEERNKIPSQMRLRGIKFFNISNLCHC